MILAIDPGTVQSAVLGWDGERIVRSGILSNKMVEVALQDAGREQHVAIERVESYGMPVGREVFETCFWCGKFWSIAESCGAKVSLVPRREVKLHLCGQARAKDANISQALRDRFGEKGTKNNPGMTFGLKADLWQAFALAVTCFDLPDLLTTHAAPN